MANYTTIDYLTDLSSTEISSAKSLNFSKYVPAKGVDNSLLGWDNQANFFTSEDFALLNDTFVFEGKENATYDIFSSSFLDPYILLLYDNKGNVIATDKDQGTLGSDMIFEYVAPYTGKYYVSASWHQGISAENKFVSVSVYEDVDTIPSTPPAEPPIQVPIASDNRDRVCNWGESAYTNLFPDHQNSQDVFGYYARIYSNGDALGEKDGSIYYYDGGVDGTKEIVMVGAVTDYLLQAEAAGF